MYCILAISSIPTGPGFSSINAFWEAPVGKRLDDSWAGSGIQFSKQQILRSLTWSNMFLALRSFVNDHVTLMIMENLRSYWVLLCFIGGKSRQQSLVNIHLPDKPSPLCDPPTPQRPWDVAARVLALTLVGDDEKVGSFDFHSSSGA